MDPERIVKQYSDMLLHLAASRLDSAADAEDCVQEVFLKLMSRNVSFRNAEHEKAWLIRCTINQANDFRRAAYRKNVPLDGLEDDASEEDPLHPVLDAVRSLPGKYGAVLHLFYYEGYSIKEIAEMLALPQATVGTRLARGRKLLGNILKEDEI